MVVICCKQGCKFKLKKGELKKPKGLNLTIRLRIRPFKYLKRNYLSSTSAPASSNAFLIPSASSLPTFSVNDPKCYYIPRRLSVP